MPLGTAPIWDMHPKYENKRLVAIRRGHASAVVSATFSQNGRQLLTASSDNTARLWDVSIRRLVTTIAKQQYPNVSPDGSRFITFSGMSANIWSAGDGKVLTTLQGHRSRIRSAGFSSDGKMALTASEDQTARLWDVESGKEILVLKANGKLDSAIFSPNGRRVLTLSKAAAQLWDAQSGQEIAAFQASSDVEQRLKSLFFPDSRTLLLVQDDAQGLLVDAKTGASLETLNFHNDVVNIAFSPDGEYFSVNNRFLWDIRGKRQIEVREEPERFQDPDKDTIVGPVRFTPDGPRLISFVFTGRPRNLQSTGLEIDDLTGARLEFLKFPHVQYLADLESIQFSPDGSRILVVTGQEVWLGAANGSVPLVSVTTNGPVAESTFSPDNKFVVTTTYAGGGEIWISDARTGALIIGIAASEAEADETVGFHVQFLANDRGFLTSLSPSWWNSRDQNVQIWKIPLRCQELIDVARESAPRELTQAEQDRYFLKASSDDRLTRLYTLVRPWFQWVLPRVGDACP